jgi:hypothetical protein
LKAVDFGTEEQCLGPFEFLLRARLRCGDYRGVARFYSKNSDAVTSAGAQSIAAINALIAREDFAATDHLIEGIGNVSCQPSLHNYRRPVGAHELFEFDLQGEPSGARREIVGALRQILSLDHLTELLSIHSPPVRTG